MLQPPPARLDTQAKRKDWEGSKRQERIASSLIWGSCGYAISKNHEEDQHHTSHIMRWICRNVCSQHATAVDFTPSFTCTAAAAFQGDGAGGGGFGGAMRRRDFAGERNPTRFLLHIVFHPCRVLSAFAFLEILFIARRRRKAVRRKPALLFVHSLYPRNAVKSSERVLSCHTSLLKSRYTAVFAMLEFLLLFLIRTKKWE